MRADDHPHYYGAFVYDPDGNNIEVVCHEAKGQRRTVGPRRPTLG